MSTSYTVAVVQFRPEPSAQSSNLARTVERIDEAAARGARLVVLPELCTTGYALQDRGHVKEQAEVVPGGPTLAAWEAAAKRLNVYVVGGLIEVEGRDLFNTAALVGPEGYIGRYRKAHLFAPEKAIFRPGHEDFPVFETEIGRLGLLICFDLRFPEAPRALALAGAEVLCVPTTWTDLYKPNPWDAHGYCMANYLAKVHAYTNRFYVACADRVGREGGMLYLGSSLIVDPGGEVVAGPATRDGEELLLAQVDLGRARTKGLGEVNDLFRDRRPDLYASLAAKDRTGTDGSTEPNPLL